MSAGHADTEYSRKNHECRGIEIISFPDLQLDDISRELGSGLVPSAKLRYMIIRNELMKKTKNSSTIGCSFRF